MVEWFGRLSRLRRRILERKTKRLISEAQTLEAKAEGSRRLNDHEAARRREQAARELRFLAERTRLLQIGGGRDGRG